MVPKLQGVPEHLELAVPGVCSQLKHREPGPSLRGTKQAPEPVLGAPCPLESGRWRGIGQSSPQAELGPPVPLKQQYIVSLSIECHYIIIQPHGDQTIKSQLEMSAKRM